MRYAQPRRGGKLYSRSRRGEDRPAGGPHPHFLRGLDTRSMLFGDEQLPSATPCYSGSAEAVAHHDHCKRRPTLTRSGVSLFARAVASTGARDDGGRMVVSSGSCLRQLDTANRAVSSRRAAREWAIAGTRPDTPATRADPGHRSGIPHAPSLPSGRCAPRHLSSSRISLTGGPS